MKTKEARGLIREEGRRVEEVVYHLGYRHPNDLSRATSGAREDR